MIAFINALVVAQIVQKDQLIARSLEANRAYAAKLAETVDLYVESIQRQLEVSASRLPAMLASQEALDAEALRVAKQSDGVVAAFVADSANRIIAFESLAPELTEKPAELSRVEIDQREVAGHVSAAYLSAKGFPTVLFSEPVRDAKGEYLGLVGAAIFLKRDNELDRLISVHFHHDGSYVYVVDSHGKILVHRDKSRIGTSESGNVVVDAVGRGEAGAMAVTNTRGKRFFAGYAPMRSGNWGVVVQTPEDVILEPQQDLLWRSLLYSVPAAVLTLLLIYVLARWIAQPLSRLAQAMLLRGDEGRAALQGVSPWYFEAQQLREAVGVTLAQHQRQITELNTETLTDPMTRLLNRRGVEDEVERLKASRQPFAVLALDIDHFKRVNDTFGHAAGDKVLILLGDLMRASIRAGDLPCRVGGEEFLVLMPAGDVGIARRVAERIRSTVERTDMPEGVGRITISIGVARWPEDSGDTDAVMKFADQALYGAKNAGRNRVVVYPF
ncbi:diguanylate cyclase (GGDEF) domain protein [compost metagenome]